MNIKAKIYLYIIISFLSFENLYAQDLNENYMLFSNSKESSEYIEFITDSTLIRKPYYSSVGCGLANLSKQTSENIYKEYKYTRENNTLTIFDFNESKNVEYRITENNYFENTKTKKVYVLRKIFGKYPDVAVKYNGEYYWLDSPESSNGVITKKGRKNRKIARILKNKDTTNLEVKVYREYEAFEKFGYKYVFGIIELTDKKR